MAATPPHSYALCVPTPSDLGVNLFSIAGFGIHEQFLTNQALPWRQQQEMIGRESIFLLSCLFTCSPGNCAGQLCSFFFKWCSVYFSQGGSCWIAVFCLESFTLYFNMTQGQIGPIIDAESKLFLCNAALCKSKLLVLLGVTIKGRNLFIFYSQPCLKLCTGECLCGRASFSKGAHPEVIGHRRRREGHSMPLLWIFCWRKSLPFLVVLWHYFISFQNQR